MERYKSQDSNLSLCAPRRELGRLGEVAGKLHDIRRHGTRVRTRCALHDDATIRSPDIEAQITLAAAVGPLHAERRVAALAEEVCQRLWSLSAGSIEQREIGVGALPSTDGFCANPDECGVVGVGNVEAVVTRAATGVEVEDVVEDECHCGAGAYSVAIDSDGAGRGTGVGLGEVGCGSLQAGGDGLIILWSVGWISGTTDDGALGACPLVRVGGVGEAGIAARGGWSWVHDLDRTHAAAGGWSNSNSRDSRGCAAVDRDGGVVGAGGRSDRAGCLDQNSTSEAVNRSDGRGALSSPGSGFGREADCCRNCGSLESGIGCGLPGHIATVAVQLRRPGGAGEILEVADVAQPSETTAAGEVVAKVEAGVEVSSGLVADIKRVLHVVATSQGVVLLIVVGDDRTDCAKCRTGRGRAGWCCRPGHTRQALILRIQGIAVRVGDVVSNTVARSRVQCVIRLDSRGGIHLTVHSLVLAIGSQVEDVEVVASWRAFCKRNPYLKQELCTHACRWLPYWTLRSSCCSQ